MAQVRQPQAPLPYRASVVLVPLDVRVVDGDGKPVTNLTAADFAIFENGVRQQIAHFSTQSYVAPTSPSATASAPPPRTFFLLLGRGRLNEPARALDAVIGFVRSQLRPADRIGLLAYLHLVEPTTDHGAVARLLERYLARHDAIEDKLERDSKRGSGAPSWPTLPDTQAAIETLFDAPGLPAVQRFPGGAAGSHIPFHDGPSLTSTLEYLGHVEGEKHLIVVLENALPLGRDGEALFGARAASARATVFVIQAGGVPGPRPLTGRLGGVFDQAPSLTPVFAARADRTLAELTGGQAFFAQNADAALARVARATSFQYVLGYYPIEPPRDGEYRQLRVAVDRRGATVLYRHAYQARPPVQAALDLRRTFVRSRILELAATPQWTPPPGGLGLSYAYGANIPLKLTPAVQRGPGRVSQVRLDVAIDPTYVTVTRDGDEHLISLDMAAFVRNAERTVIGEQWEHLDLTLDASGYARLKREQIRHTFALTVTGRPSDAVIVVYEYESNRGRWALAKLR